MRQINKLILGSATLLLVLAVGCKTSSKNGDTPTEDAPEFVAYSNPPAEGFDLEGSDQVAIILADQVMNAMGGRQRWDQTKVLYWSHFGRRDLLWDKENNKVRVDMPSADWAAYLDMNDMTGTVWKAGEKVENPDSVKKYLESAHQIWVNDSYWLVMPFKLKDSGVTLKYLREDTTLAGERADLLKLTFKNVGLTPQNAYLVWVSLEDRLVKQWRWYRNEGDEEPVFTLPWDKYESYDSLLIAKGRGHRDLTKIKVMDQVPHGAFEKPGPLDL